MTGGRPGACARTWIPSLPIYPSSTYSVRMYVLSINFLLHSCNAFCTAARGTGRLLEGGQRYGASLGVCAHANGKTDEYLSMYLSTSEVRTKK